MKRRPYAYVCPKCQHPASRHWLAPGGELREGPYRCEECGCERPQEAGDIPMSRAQFEAHLARLES